MANVSGYKILRFWANPQKYQILMPAKNSHLKISTYNMILLMTCVWYSFPQVWPSRGGEVSYKGTSMFCWMH